MNKKGCKCRKKKEQDWLSDDSPKIESIPFIELDESILKDV